MRNASKKLSVHFASWIREERHTAFDVAAKELEGRCRKVGGPSDIEGVAVMKRLAGSASGENKRIFNTANDKGEDENADDAGSDET